MSDNAVNTKKIELQEQLDAAQQAAESGAWDTLTYTLTKAQEIAGADSALRKLVSKQETRIQQFRKAEVSRLLAEAETLLNDEQNFLEGRIGQLLDEALQLAPDDARIASLRERLSQTAVRRRERAAYEAALQQCQVLWKREQELVQAQVASGEILETCYRAAVRIAEKTAANYTDSALMRGLVRQAEIAYNQARNRYEARTTAEETGDFKSLIESLREEKDKNKLIPWRNLKGEEQEPITVAEALSEAEILAVNYAEQKAQQYQQDAQQHMANHAPRAAKEVLLRSRTLFMLDDESKGIIEQYLQNSVEPEIGQLTEAEKKLQQVARADYPDKGWRLIGEALEIYPHAPGVGEARQALLPRLIEQVERKLQEARSDLKLDRLDKALKLAEEAVTTSNQIAQHSADLGLLELEKQGRSLNQKATTLLAACQQEDRLVRELADQADKIGALLQAEPGKAMQRWADLVSQYGDETIERFPRLRQLRQDVETAGGIQMLTARLDSAFASNERSRIENALPDVEANIAKQEYADYRQQLVALQSRLQLRRDYLLALDVLHNSGDAEAALALFSHIAGQKGHPDAVSAQEEAKRIRENKELETKIANALQTAGDHMKAQPARPKQAYQALSPFKDEVSTHKREVDQLLRQAHQLWTAQLVERADKELRKSAPHPDKLDGLVSELEKLPEPRPVETVNRVKAHAAAARARQHERVHEWPEALAEWEKALQRDILNMTFKEGKQRSRKKVAEIELSRLEDEKGDAGQEGKETVKGFFQKLEEDLPLDPEVRFWRARYYADRAKKRSTTAAKKREYYALAEEGLAAAQEIFARQQKPDPVLQGKAKDLQQNVVTADDLARQQQEVERKLTSPETRSLAEVERARQDAQKLMTEYKQNTAVADWWQEQRDHAIEQLKNANDTLDPQETWERFAIGSKILILNPAHVLAQQFVRDLPNRAEDMNREIERVIDDKEGFLISDTTDEKTVEAQLQKVEAIQADARAIYDRLVGFREQIPQGAGSVETLSNVLRDNLEKLNSFLSDLEKLRQLKGRAETYLKQAKIDGKWQNFDEVIRQINQAGFHNHRAKKSLSESQLAIQTRRTELIKMQQALKTVAESEQFAAALHIMATLEDPTLGDPDDAYGLRTNLQVTDPLNRNNLITNWRALKNWLKERQAQLESVVNWLMMVGLIQVLDEYAVSLPVRSENDPAGFVNWEQTRQQIINLTESGNFTNAAQLSEQALDGNGDWFDDGNRLLALRPARDRLRLAPIKQEQALSQRVKELLDAAKIQHENLTPKIEQAERNLATVKRKDQQWHEAYSNLQYAFRELDAIRRNPVTRWRKKEEIAAARQKVYEAIQVCSSIAPYHPALVDARNNRLLR